MAKKNIFLKISFFLKEIAMYACMHEMQTHFKKERNKYRLYLHITHNKQALQMVSLPLFLPHAYSMASFSS